MRQVLAITKALADRNRLRIVHALAERGELCVCQLYELLQLAPSTTSKHLSQLAAAGLVDVRKDGRWAYYRIAATDAAARGALEWALAAMADQPEIDQDSQALAQILALSPEELCARQAQGQRCCSCAPETPAEAKWPKAGRAI
ncbi:metalloregulator ArsR/SmtB family transcription factor [bacterium]|nr:metalloregulator ArsR/SmtB family transcription factor [bacterium]